MIYTKPCADCGWHGEPNTAGHQLDTYTMRLPVLTSVKTADEARNLAIDWEQWSSQQNLSYSELADWQNLFETLATRFNLTNEFAENGVI